jgi:hypothetical protein
MNRMNQSNRISSRHPLLCISVVLVDDPLPLYRSLVLPPALMIVAVVFKYTFSSICELTLGSLFEGPKFLPFLVESIRVQLAYTD